MKGTIPASCGRHHSFQPLLWIPRVARHVTYISQSSKVICINSYLHKRDRPWRSRDVWQAALPAGRQPNFRVRRGTYLSGEYNLITRATFEGQYPVRCLAPPGVMEKSLGRPLSEHLLSPVPYKGTANHRLQSPESCYELTPRIPCSPEKVVASHAFNWYGNEFSCGEASAALTFLRTRHSVTY